MASVLEPVTFDPTCFEEELTQFETLLSSKPELSEQKDVLPFFKERKHLTAFMGSLYLNVAVAKEVCFEFNLSNNFRADILLGSKEDGQFCLVEFEAGNKGAIFKKQRNRKNPEWSSLFEHAFSQIVDWFWALEDLKNTADFRTTFGENEPTFASLIVIGRSANLDDAKKRRLAWRTNKVLINTHKVTCVTFDQLHDSLREKFEFSKAATRVERRPPAS